MKMNQKQRLLKYLKKYKTITPLEALRDLGIYRLSGQIFILRNEGHKITTETKDVLNRFGETCHIANYIYEE